MKENIIKYGVIGLKRGADVAIEGRYDKRGALVAACDRDPEARENAKKLFEKHGITECKFYETFEELLATDIDAVIIATDAVCHVPYVIGAMNAGKHVLCEIPSINTVEEAKILKDAVESHPDLIYMAGENCCFWAFVETWKRMYEEGQLGEIVYAEGEYLHSIDPKNFAPDNYPKGHWRITNPAIKYITHEMGPLLYILNDRCVSVTCTESNIVYNPYFPEKNATGVATFKTAKGTILHILISFGTYIMPDHNFRLCGTRGSVETDRLKKYTEAHTFANLQDVPDTFKTKLDIPVTTRYEGETEGAHGGGDKKMMSEFLRCIAENQKPAMDVDFAIRMTMPGILAHESAVRGGIPVEIPEL
ncbi:MAG: Gfo/Idh/MocA family oxidoreductase [Clostridia bacterium]|nr:Gfo/Idh/MocA family oxidoreductase [Clostridia bacterium]